MHVDFTTIVVQIHNTNSDRQGIMAIKAKRFILKTIFNDNRKFNFLNDIIDEKTY